MEKSEGLVKKELLFSLCPLCVVPNDTMATQAAPMGPSWASGIDTEIPLSIDALKA